MYILPPGYFFTISLLSLGDIQVQGARENGRRDAPYFGVRDAGDALFWCKGGGRHERKECKGGAYVNLQKLRKRVFRTPPLLLRYYYSRISISTFQRGGQFRYNSSHLRGANFKIFSNHGEQ